MAEAGILFRVVIATVGALVPHIVAVDDTAVWAVEARVVAHLATLDQLRTGARAPLVWGPAFDRWASPRLVRPACFPTCATLVGVDAAFRVVIEDSCASGLSRIAL